jgi:hypothetical protein
MHKERNGTFYGAEKPMSDQLRPVPSGRRHPDGVCSLGSDERIAVRRINRKYRMRLFKMREGWRNDTTTPSATILIERQEVELNNTISCLKEKAEYLSNTMRKRLFRVENSH